MDRKKGEKMKHVNTTEMYFKVINCEEADELKEIINKYSPYYSNWRDYINNVMLVMDYLTKNQVKYVDLAKILLNHGRKVIKCQNPEKVL